MSYVYVSRASKYLQVRPWIRTKLVEIKDFISSRILISVNKLCSISPEYQWPVS